MANFLQYQRKFIILAAGNRQDPATKTPDPTSRPSVLEHYIWHLIVSPSGTEKDGVIVSAVTWILFAKLAKVHHF